MSKEKKAQIIDQLQEVFTKCSVCILTDYRGMSTAEITNLRRKLGESGIQYRVVKNTLAQFAAERTHKTDLLSFFVGPIAITTSYSDDITEPAKILTDYISTEKVSLSIKGGFSVDRIFTVEDVMALSRLPAREVLLGKIMGGMQSPIYGLVNCLASPVRGFMMVLQARIQQLEGA